MTSVVRSWRRAPALKLVAALAATPVMAQQVDVQERIEHYIIRGRTADALLSEMLAKGPPATFEPGKRYFARAEYSVGWSYRFKPSPDGCALTEFDVSVDTTYTYPLWEDREEAGDRLNAYWDHFLSRIEIHERGHGDRALGTGVDVAKALKALAPAVTCDALEAEIGAAAKATMKIGEKKQRDYDRETNHGQTQGAWFNAGDARRFRAPKDATRE